MHRHSPTAWETLEYIFLPQDERIAMYYALKAARTGDKSLLGERLRDRIQRDRDRRIRRVLGGVAFVIVLYVVLIRWLGTDFLRSPQYKAMGIGFLAVMLVAFLISTLSRSNRSWLRVVAPLARRRWRLARCGPRHGSEHEIALRTEDLLRRRRAWLAVLDRRIGWFQYRNAAGESRLVVLAAGSPFLLQFLIQLLGGLKVSDALRATFLCSSILFCFGFYYGIVRWQADRLRRRILAAIEGHACPDCGYSLLGVPPAKPQAPELGPRFCPECAARWPLVPPRAPGEAPRYA